MNFLFPNALEVYLASSCISALVCSWSDSIFIFYYKYYYLLVSNNVLYSVSHLLICKYYLTKYHEDWIKLLWEHTVYYYSIHLILLLIMSLLLST